MKIIFVAGAWGSGTSAVIGALDGMGMQTHGPHALSTDPRTPNTFELESFREVVHRFVDDATLKAKFDSSEQFIAALKLFRQQIAAEIDCADAGEEVEQCLVLKMPLASLCLYELHAALDVQIILVHRPLQEIEATRLRRKWPARYGGQGAGLIYNKMFTDLIKHGLSFLGISHADFVRDTQRCLARIAAYCDVAVSDERIDTAAAFVRKQ